MVVRQKKFEYLMVRSQGIRKTKMAIVYYCQDTRVLGQYGLGDFFCLYITINRFLRARSEKDLSDMYLDKQTKQLPR